MRFMSSFRAALLATAAVAMTSPVLAAENFKGFYGGLSIGFGEFDARIHDRNYAWHGDTQTVRSNGTLFGGQLGHNWQSKNTAWGVELDLFASTIDTNYVYSGNSAFTSELNWTGSVRGRAGLAFGETYLYQTVGLAAVDYEGSWLYSGQPDPAYDWADLGDTRFGAVAGFGIEHVTSGDWSFKIEATASKFAVEDGFNAPDGGIRIHELGRDDTVYALKFGFNNKFGASRKPDNNITPGNAFDFSGFFAGLHLGGHQAAVSLTDVHYNDFGGTNQRVGEGVVAGLQAGYNVQNDGFLFGVELQGSWLDGDGDFDYRGKPNHSYFRDTHGSINYTADLRLKAGIAADNTLMYVLGGVALADTENAHAVYRPAFDYAVDVGGTNWGLVTGAGIETAITPNLTGRIETTFSAFNGDTSLDTDGDGPYRGHSTDVSVKAGLNYYFGDRGGWGMGAAAPSNWAGWFVGLDGIFAYHEGVIYDRDYDEFGSDYILPSFGGGIGLNAGRNWQDGSFVYGVIADLAIYSNDESETDIDLDYRTVSSSLNWMGSVRGRAGLATGLGHLYATAGFAFAGIDQAHDAIDLGGPNTGDFIFNDQRVGWTAGMGVERKVGGRGSVKLEALYTSFGTETAQIADGDTCGPRICEMDALDRNVTVKVGYTYKLGE